MADEEPRTAAPPFVACEGCTLDSLVCAGTVDEEEGNPEIAAVIRRGVGNTKLMADYNMCELPFCRCAKVDIEDKDAVSQPATGHVVWCQVCVDCTSAVADDAERHGYGGTAEAMRALVVAHVDEATTTLSLCQRPSCIARIIRLDKHQEEVTTNAGAISICQACESAYVDAVPAPFRYGVRRMLITFCQPTEEQWLCQVGGCSARAAFWATFLDSPDNYCLREKNGPVCASCYEVFQVTAKAIRRHGQCPKLLKDARWMEHLNGTGNKDECTNPVCDAFAELSIVPRAPTHKAKSLISTPSNTAGCATPGVRKAKHLKKYTEAQKKAYNSRE